MLQDIRENSQGVVAKIIIGLIVAVFALTGMEMLGRGLLQPEVAEVNGEEITQFQLDQNVQNLLASVGGQLEGIDQGLLESIALNQLIEETILRQQAFNTSMVISNSRLDRNILATPSFQIYGVFNSDIAIRTMAAQGLNVDGYRQLLTQNMLVSQMASAYTNSNFVTESELNK